MRKGMQDWLQERQPDIVTLQEVRAPDELIGDLIGEGWFVVHAESSDKGRAGVAIASRFTPATTRIGVGPEYFASSGRWVEAEYTTADGKSLVVASIYAHSGDETSEVKMADKHAFFDALKLRGAELQNSHDLVLLTGDFNIAHTERDIKNWKGNLKKAGFLPEERAHMDEIFGPLGWVDIARSIAGDVDGPYSWWSYRGKAFDNDTGWRIDYHAATPPLAKLATEAVVDRAPSYDTRWSDHAPVVVTYDLALVDASDQ